MSTATVGKKKQEKANKARENGNALYKEGKLEEGGYPLPSPRTHDGRH